MRNEDPVVAAPPRTGLAPKVLGDLVGGYVVESRQPLPASVLWEIQRTFYDMRGGDAWASGSVPHHITCNPAIARGYAHAVLGFARDCRANGALPPGSVLRILEVGGGSGRFAGLLLRCVVDLVAASSLSDVQVRYILTDFSDERLRQLRDHPGLAEEQRSGMLRLVRLDAADPATSPAASEEVGLDPGDLPGPVVVVANYVLDSLAQECVALRDRDALRGLLTTTSPRRIDGPVQPADLDRLEFSWDFDPTGLPDSLDPALEDVLCDYRATLDDTILLLPTAALDCLRTLCRERETPTLALLADKGTTRRRDLLGLGPPGLALHGGCFSLMVNFDALAGVVERWGGLALHPPDRATNLVVAAYLLPGRGGSSGVGWPETSLAYGDHLGTAGPDDWFLVHSMVGEPELNPSMEQALALLRVSRWDPAVFLRLAPTMLDLAPHVPEVLRADVVRAMRAIWDAYVPIGEDAEVATLIGLVLGGMRCNVDALAFYDLAIAEHGRSANALFGSALAWADLGDRSAAERAAAAALEVDPSLGAARALLVTLAEEA